MNAVEFAHLERHVLEAGKGAHEARHLLGLCDADSPTSDCVEQLCIAVDELGIVVMALLNEAKPKEPMSDAEFSARIGLGEK